jgi:hypothetical protein
MKAWLLVTLLVVSSGAASAFTSVDIAGRVYSSVTFGEIYIDAAQRKVMALAIQEYWADFDKKLPRLSPAEQKWVEGELDTTESSRLSRIINTKEYQLWSLARTVDNCNASVLRLIGSQDDPALASSEMFNWLKVANCYRDSNGSVRDALNAAGFPQEQGVLSGYGLDNMILGNILNVVIPSAMADTMGWTLSSD